MQTQVCPQCGQEFQAYLSQRRVYCSRQCLAAAGVAVKKKTGRFKPCEECGKDFWVFPAKEATARFCSQACKDKPKLLTEYECLECGSTFTAWPSMNRQFCSPACSAKNSIGRKMPPRERKPPTPRKPRPPKQRLPIACKDCGESFMPKRTGVVPQRCEPCRVAYERKRNNAKQVAWRAANPERAKAMANKHNRARISTPEYRRTQSERIIKAKYGITREELDAMIEAQAGRCAICAGPPNGPGSRLHIDHCHDTGRIRGLLCGKCNTAIGLLCDDPERAERAAAYLRKKE